MRDNNVTRAGFSLRPQPPAIDEILRAPLVFKPAPDLRSGALGD